jgi:hypothetical protein
VPYDLGGPEGIRTLGHLVKSQMLYLAELQALLKAREAFIGQDSTFTTYFYILYSISLILKQPTPNIDTYINSL